MNPWTPGPWKDDGGVIVGADGSWVDQDAGYLSDEDMRLVVAAPEMAELLAEWIPSTTAWPSDVRARTQALLARIRGE